MLMIRETQKQNWAERADGALFSILRILVVIEWQNLMASHREVMLKINWLDPWGNQSNASSAFKSVSKPVSYSRQHTDSSMDWTGLKTMQCNNVNMNNTKHTDIHIELEYSRKITIFTMNLTKPAFDKRSRGVNQMRIIEICVNCPLENDWLVKMYLHHRSFWPRRPSSLAVRFPVRCLFDLKQSSMSNVCGSFRSRCPAVGQHLLGGIRETMHTS